MNPVAEKMTGWESAELKGKTLKDIIGNKGTSSKTNERIPDNNVRSIIINAKDGSERSLSVCVTTVKKDDGTVTGNLIHLQDASVNQENRDEIIYISNHDALTDLFNRGYFERQLKSLTKKNPFLYQF
jgi:PAS domain S-box-containing protein